METVSCLGVSNFITPFIFFRIAPILALPPQVLHPGTVNWTAFSAACAVPGIIQTAMQTNNKSKDIRFKDLHPPGRH